MIKMDQTYFELAGFLFEKARGVYDQYIEFRLHDGQFNQFSAEDVAVEVASYISNNVMTTDELLPAAICALGQSHNKQYFPLYIEVMKTSQVSNVAACLQAAIACEKGGCSVFGDRDDIVDEASLLICINEYLKDK